jgi:hypothetical protein
MNIVISTDSVLTVSPTVAQQYQLTVTGSDNQSKTLYTDLLIRGEIAIATFEDNYLPPESYWQGREGSNGEETKFYSGSFSFVNSSTPNYWGGFAYSNITATDFNPSQYVTHQFRSVVGHGVDGSDTYSVVYAMGVNTKIEVIHSEAATTIPGVYLTNAAWTYSSIINGDDFGEEPFEQGDYYKVVFKGNTGTTVEHYLADYRSSNAAEHYIVTDWKWFDLSALGNITSLTVSVAGSRNNQWGLTTPAYLCMDNLGATEPVISDKPTTPTNLQGIATQTTIALSWNASTGNTAIAGYNIYVDNEFAATVPETNHTITDLLPDTKYYIEVEAFNEAGNKSDKAAIYVTTDKPNGIDDLTLQPAITVYPNPFTDYIMVKTDTDSRISLYNISGQCLLTTLVKSGETCIETTNLPKGTYILKCGERAVKLVK